ncbi:hypothetical protein GCM10023115_16040 [Pontixanthobacter gangjinensis]|uniref:DUF4304 domain-containing protein n=1 Tax=Pontixanthobacter gangjinensis TaxID=1028742 RepID=A0A6I4SPS9_9SPHN|nr:hypothetical protein [Pontixanthobacter gangjinensis]MXO56847.1 hypothetical protein [Pontixanthobacter gangjinensis]
MARRASNRPMRKAIRDIVEPAIEALGFTGKYPAWQRAFGEEFHFIELRTDKYGGCFGISGAWGTAKDFGDHPPSLPATDFEHRASITRPIELWTIEGEAYTHWISAFDYQYILGDPNECSALAQEAADGLSALKQWFASKEFTNGVKPVFSKIGSAVNGKLISAIASAKAEMGLY